MRAVIDVVVATLLAPPCVSCGAVLDSTRSPACARCWRNLHLIEPPACIRCGAPLLSAAAHVRCPGAGSAITRAAALGPFQGVLRDLIHAFKYDSRRSLADALAARMPPPALDVVEAADALVPVPLHPWRHWRRGFNQADDLAAAMGRVTNRPVWRLLRRISATRSQAALDAAARRRNVDGAFAPAGWTSRGRSRTASRAAGRILVLVDDVATTGATLEACARVLAECGAQEVRALTLARVT